MFGYVRPLKPELKVKEYEMFRAAYCGLCTQLKRSYGGMARYVISYDLTFLAMLLAGKDELPHVCSGRCPASPCRRKKYLRCGAEYETAAAQSVILMYWKLVDAARDGGLKQKLYAAPLSVLLKRKYRRAAAAQPYFAAETQRLLAELARLEEERNASLDAAADSFARILQAAAKDCGDPDRERILSQLLYHLGRFIYILDAVDDYEEDCKSGSYNPLIYRFETGGRALNGEEREELRLTLRHSIGLIGAAYELKDKNVYDGILSNIIYLGLENAVDLVFSGRSGELKMHLIHKNN